MMFTCAIWVYFVVTYLILAFACSDESLVNSIESSLEDIQLNDDAKLEESCVFVDDSELYAVSCRTQKLRSYKVLSLSSLIMCFNG